MKENETQKRADCCGIDGRPGSKDHSSGFALVITVVLLALLVMVIYALSALLRVGADISASDANQAQARQHALLGLGQALGRLRQDAAEDQIVTGMAGIAGVAEGAGQYARHWCGVWDENARFVRWLASGETGAVLPRLDGPDAVALAASGSLGAENLDREYVRALAVPVVTNTRSPVPALLGKFAWWAGDEGAKLSAVLPGEKHALDELIPLSPAASGLPAALSYEQIALVPTAVSPAVLAGQLRANFHALGRTHFSCVGGSLGSGLLNINSTSLRYWRGVGATYNRLKPAVASAIDVAAFAAWMNAHITAADPEAAKAANEPFLSVELFLAGETLAGALDQSGGSVSDFAEVMHLWLTVRSDTFRVRAYGEAANPSDPAKIEAVAWCEAVVQRVKDSPADHQGRFVVTYFRWLSFDDI